MFEMGEYHVGLFSSGRVNKGSLSLVRDTGDHQHDLREEIILLSRWFVAPHTQGTM
jgi:hypothetical protein